MYRRERASIQFSITAAPLARILMVVYGLSGAIVWGVSERCEALLRASQQHLLNHPWGTRIEIATLSGELWLRSPRRFYFVPQIPYSTVNNPKGVRPVDEGGNRLAAVPERDKSELDSILDHFKNFVPRESLSRAQMSYKNGAGLMAEILGTFRNIEIMKERRDVFSVGFPVFADEPVGQELGQFNFMFSSVASVNIRFLQKRAERDFMASDPTPSEIPKEIRWLVERVKETHFIFDARDLPLSGSKCTLSKVHVANPSAGLWSGPSHAAVEWRLSARGQDRTIDEIIYIPSSEPEHVSIQGLQNVATDLLRGAREHALALPELPANAMLVPKFRMERDRLVVPLFFTNRDGTTTLVGTLAFSQSNLQGLHPNAKAPLASHSLELDFDPELLAQAGATDAKVDAFIYLLRGYLGLNGNPPLNAGDFYLNAYDAYLRQVHGDYD